MKTLSHLQNEAMARFDHEYLVGNLKIDGERDGNIVPLKDIKGFILQELETIVKESFKNTRVEEITSTPQGRDERDAYNEALKNIKDTQNQFLNN